MAAIAPTEAWAVGSFGPTQDQTLAFHLKYTDPAVPPDQSRPDGTAATRADRLVP